MTVAGNHQQHVSILVLSDLRLDRTIPAALADLRRLDLYDYGLTGASPRSSGTLRTCASSPWRTMTSRGTFRRSWGSSCGSSSFVEDNDQTGTLPADLANLGQLEGFYALDNGLPLAIPAWLTELTNLTHLFLEGNSFTRFIAAGLRDVANHDIENVSWRTVP